MPRAARAMATLDMAHPSPQIVDRSPGPSTPIGSLAHDRLHWVYMGGKGMMRGREANVGAEATKLRMNSGISKSSMLLTSSRMERIEQL
jgi:hypothetical protein